MVDALDGRSVEQCAGNVRVNRRIGMVKVLAPGLDTASSPKIAKVEPEAIGVRVVNQPMQFVVGIVGRMPIGVREANEVPSVVIFVVSKGNRVALVGVLHVQLGDASFVPLKVDGPTCHLRNHGELSELVIRQLDP